MVDRSAPDAGRAHRVAGWNLYHVNRHADALREAQLALGSDPNDADAHRLRALALSTLGRHAEARKAVGDALQADPKSEWSHRIRAHVLLQSGQLQPALAAVHEAIRLLPNAPEGHSFEAEIHLRLGKNVAALGAARRALSLRPDHVASLIRATHAAERMGKSEQALDFARRALSADPQSGDAHRALGVAAFRAGDRATAGSALREALRLDPHNEAARIELLRTIRSRSPIYRVTDQVTRWFQASGAKITRGLGIALAMGARGIAEATGHQGFLLVFLLVPVAFYLPLWIIPLHDLIVWRDPFGRWLLDRWEKLGAAFTAAALAVALVLLTVFVATRRDAWAWSSAGFAALGAYGAMIRRVRTRGAAWRIGVGAVVLISDLLVAVVANARGDRDLAIAFACSFLLTTVVAIVTRRWLIGNPPARRR